MFKNVLKSAPLVRLDQADKIEFLEAQTKTNNIINQLKQYNSQQTHTKQQHYQQKKFAIMGTKLAETTDSTESLAVEDPDNNHEASERIGKLLLARNTPYKATDILSQILQKNLNNYNHLINYNYRVRNHEDELRNNRLNFLYGMRHTEQTFSVRPASLNELNERLSQIYTIRGSSRVEPDRKDSSTQTRIVYNLSKKQTANGSSSAVAAYNKNRKNRLDSASMESLELPTFMNKLGLVEFNDFQSHH